MALIKEVDTNYGVKAGYWRIETITIDKRMKEANFIICLYLNKEATESFDYRAVILADKENKEELFEKYFSDKIIFTDIYNSCYECAKEIDEFFADAKPDSEEILKMAQEDKNGE